MTDTPELSPFHNGMSKSGSPVFNHNLENDEDDEIDAGLIEKIKGDAIGDTLYSQRFVLTTLMKLPNLDKPISDDEDYEKDLCTLWDQTVEKDVVKFLLEYKVLEVFAASINEEDGRLTEILVGIIANMCAVTETRQQLEASPEITIVLISLISSDDPLVLIQLMRFFHAVLVFENAGDELIWFQYFAAVENFVEKFSFVLASSTSNTLLRHTLEALHAICAKFAVIEIRPEGGQTNFVDMFVQPLLICSLIEAFNQVVKTVNEIDDSQEDEEDEERKKQEAMSFAPTENTAKFMSLFLDVNVILTQYDQVSKRAYSDKLSDFLHCLGLILEPLCQSEYLFPLCTTTQGIIENLSDILQALEYPFDSKYWTHLMWIYVLIVRKRRSSRAKNSKKKETSDWEADSDTDDSEEDESDSDQEGVVDENDLCHTILEIIGKGAMSTTPATLEEVVKEVERKTVKDFLNFVETVQEDKEMLKEVLMIIKKS